MLESRSLTIGFTWRMGTELPLTGTIPPPSEMRPDRVWGVPDLTGREQQIIISL
jgi:hypothetical protein